MEKIIISICLLIFCLAGCAKKEKDPAYQLAERIIPDHARFFEFETISDNEGLDVFEIETKGDKIVIRGNTGVAKASGLNYYLENFCNCQVSMNCNNLNLPAVLPKTEEKIRVETPFKYRYLFNYCTYGYSMPWWDWEKWEQMIDYMAMKGVNMPLSTIGQEAVWNEVYQELGLTREQLDNFFVGPAHLPWGWMGNIDGIGGPLPQNWINKRKDLQTKILDRERSLGMTPVLQAFTGHVPKELKASFPDAHIMQIEPWAGIPGTMFLDPTDPLFEKIGVAFIKKQTEMFGTDHLYDADCFIEVDPPSKDPEFLKKISNAVYNSMAKADPGATWVLQGWFFFFKKDFWQPEQGKGFFAGIPENKAIVLDLYGEKNPVWNKTNAFYGQPWIWNVICNEDQKVNMSGDLQAMHDQFKEAFDSEISKNLKGIGVIPEGIGYNMVVHDYILGKAWNQSEIEVGDWIEQYVTHRYGSDNTKAIEAWKLFAETVYGRTRTMWSPLLTTPGLRKYSEIKEDIRHERMDFKITKYDPFAMDFDVYRFAQGAKLLLDCAPELQDIPTYRFDMTNVFRELLHSLTHKNIHALSLAYDAKDMEDFNIAGKHLIKQLEDMEDVTGTHTEFMLGKWLEDARSWGDTDAEKKYYERNARTIVTIWQPWEDGGLRDYAGKQWNGLLSGYYKPRWELFIKTLKECLQNNSAYDPAKFDKAVRSIDFKWTKENYVYPSRPTADIIEMATRVWNDYEHIFIHN